MACSFEMGFGFTLVSNAQLCRAYQVEVQDRLIGLYGNQHPAMNWTKSATKWTGESFVEPAWCTAIHCIPKTHRGDPYDLQTLG